MKPSNLQATVCESEADQILDDLADILFDMWLEEVNDDEGGKINVNEHPAERKLHN